MLERFRKKIQEFQDYLLGVPPLIAAFIIMILVAIPIDVISKFVGWENEAEAVAMKAYFANTPLKDIIYNLLIVAPLTQEFLYRGPVRILIFLFPKMTINHAVTWLAIIVPTYYWAFHLSGGHLFPLDAFIVGTIFGWAVVETESLESAILLHILYNGLSLVGTLIKYHA